MTRYAALTIFTISVSLLSPGFAKDKSDEEKDVMIDVYIAALKSAVQQYKALSGRFPPDLKALTKAADLDGDGDLDGPFIEEVPDNP